MASIVPTGLLRTGARSCALAATLAAVLLSGCTDEATRNLLDRRADESRKGMEAAAKPPVPALRYNPLVVTDKIWTGSMATRMQRGMPLPLQFESERGVALVSSEPMTLSEVARAISQQTGIPVHLNEASGVGARAGGMSSSSASSTMSVAYEGPLSGLMERVAGNFGINWRYNGSTISITRYETRVFVVEALPGTQQVQEGMQDDTSTSSGGGGSSSSNSSSQNSLTQNSRFSMDIKYWDELGQILNAMLGGTGSVVVSPSVGTVTVTTTPEIMRSVASYLAMENDRLSRQIAINVEIYTVSLSEGIDFNVAFNTVLRRLTNFGGNFSGASAPTTVSGFTGGGTLSLAILNPNYIHGSNGSVISPVGQVTDVFTALSGVGDTAKVAKFPLITLNNRPVSRRIGKDISYVKEATTNTSGSGTSSTFAGTSLTPGQVHQGFSVQLTPRLLDDGRILLQYSLSVADVLSIDSFNSVCGASGSSNSSSCTGSSAAAGSSTIQVPTVATRVFVQQSVLKSGSTLIIGGAEEEDATQNSQGVGDPYNYLFGGGNSSGRTHTMVFFAITPQVLDVPHTERD